MRPLVQYPEMRDQVIASLQSLADQVHQRVQWGRVEEGVNYFDDLTLNVHVLYDDTCVLPEPSRAVGAVLYEAEVQPLVALHDALGPMLDDLGDQADSAYVADPRWPAVIEAARAALDAMRASERS